MWSSDVAAAQSRLAATMSARGKAVPMQRVRITPVNHAAWDGKELVPSGDTHDLGPAVCFENHTYELEFYIPDTSGAAVRHRSQRVKDAFRFDRSVLRGTLNFGNDVGWFNLDVVVTDTSGANVVYSVGLEVFSTKLDTTTDMEQMLARIDETYPLWRFSYARTTSHEMQRRRRQFERLPLVWLEQFKALRRDLVSNVRLICNAPHHRLLESGRLQRLEQLRGKLTRRQEHLVAKVLLVGAASRRIKTINRRLSVDTPENRFVLGVLRYCDRELGRFEERLKAVQGTARQGLSSDALREVTEWRGDVRTLSAHRMWGEVAEYRELHRESLVLQERAGYSGVYRVWLQLRMYLDVLGRHATISMKTISELYEVWCFLEIRRQLMLLGFRETEIRRPKVDRSGIEAQFTADGMGAALLMERGNAENGDLVKIRLAHEPLFRKRSRNSGGKHVVSWLHVQKPDIVVEATFPNGNSLYWVFDAKYRVHRAEDQAGESVEESMEYEGLADGEDLVPPDAINQMHRYRDAIVQATSDGRSTPELSRPVIGAFCLFPGWYPDVVQRSQENPYKDAIEAVAIGAFPALPGQDNPWLMEFLSSQLGSGDSSAIRSPGPEWQLAQWAARIPHSGLKVSEQAELALLAHIGGNRSKEYVKAFREGRASWFHVREAAIRRGEIAPSAMRDITHCAVALPAEDGSGSFVTHIYSVRSVSLVDRSAISPAQAGSEVWGSNEKYWLFELGESEPLNRRLKYVRPERYRVWVTSMKSFTNARSWTEIL